MVRRERPEAVSLEEAAARLLVEAAMGAGVQVAAARLGTAATGAGCLLALGPGVAAMLAGIDTVDKYFETREGGVAVSLIAGVARPAPLLVGAGGSGAGLLLLERLPRGVPASLPALLLLLA